MDLLARYKLELMDMCDKYRDKDVMTLADFQRAIFISLRTYWTCQLDIAKEFEVSLSNVIGWSLGNKVAHPRIARKILSFIENEYLK